MIEMTDEYLKWDDKFYETFGYGLPTEMLPADETTEGIIESIRKSIEAGRDLLGEIYDMPVSDDIVY